MDSPRSDRILAVIALTLLAAGCVMVLWPFMTALIWAAILASSSWPVFVRLNRWAGNRRTVTAALMTVLGVVALLGPVLAVALAQADNVAELAKAASNLSKEGLPDAPAWLAKLPLVGPTLHGYWQQFAHNGAKLIAELGKPAQAAALTGGRVLAQGVVDMALAVFLTFFFFLHGETLSARLRVALGRLTGARASYLIALVHGTVSGVIYGVLGTALAQGVLAAIGFAIAGVPGAALLGAVTFFFSVVPVGPPLIWGGAAIWLFQQGEPGWAVFVIAWGFFLVSTVDNVIKPFIISRGASLPFAIVFLGVLGGVLAFGVIGAFLGPTLLAVGYRLLLEWTGSTTDPDANPG